jgi:hypothetical protein
MVEVKSVAVYRANVRFGEELLPAMLAHDLYAPGQDCGIFEAQA